MFRGASKSFISKAPKHQRPTDPAFFTGNSNYYRIINQANEYLQQIGPKLKKNAIPSINWLPKKAMMEEHTMKLTDETYQRLIVKLNDLSVSDGNFNQ